MMRLVFLLLGYCRIRICGGSPQWALNTLTSQRISFWDVDFPEAVAAEISVLKWDVPRVLALTQGRMCTGEVIGEWGLPLHLRRMRKRWKFVAFLAALVILALTLPNYVWFFSVEGNEHIPREMILRAVRESGVTVGTRGKDIHPQKVEDRVLARIPELSWLTVTQSGGRAVIVVREKTLSESVIDRRRPQNIVASGSGVVEEISVLDGEAAVKPGDTVQEGQLLISGYMDLEYKYRATCAQGEVYARTWRQEESVTPVEFFEKIYSGKEKTVLYFSLGRLRIKISRGSGISLMNCDKMTKESLLTLPGGYTLPIGFVRETYRHYTLQAGSLTEGEAAVMLQSACVRRATEEMVAGQILGREYSMDCGDGLFRQQSVLTCREMIGRPVDAEIFKDVERYGKNH